MLDVGADAREVGGLDQQAEVSTSEALGPEEELLRRWGFHLPGEHMSEKTLSVLAVLIGNASR